MTIRQFLKALEVKRDSNWFVDSETDWIRCDQGMCPISSLMGYYAAGYITAAKMLGIKAADREKIVRAADGDKGCDKRLRRRILEAVGLSEKA